MAKSKWAKIQRAKNLADAESVLIDLEDEGFKVERLTDHHWRFKGINIWPSSKKFQKKGGEVEYYEKFKPFIKTL